MEGEKSDLNNDMYDSPGDGSSESTAIKPQARKIHDPDVTFAEYAYYAKRTREEQKHLVSPSLNWRRFMFGRKQTTDNTEDTYEAKAEEFSDDKLRDPAARMQISDEEWTNASRAFRTAGWGACFYLITTDILGPYTVGYALGTLGWGPGIALFTVFGFMAGYSGYCIWYVYLGVDSYEFPARNYGDLAFRTWGTTARHVTNFLQALALLLILGQVTIQYGQNISSVSKYRLCYAVCPVIFVCVGFLLTQIRTLKAYGWVANFSVWISLLAIFISMGVIANSHPNYHIATLGSAGFAADVTTITPDKQGNYPAIIHYNGLPPNGLLGGVNGLMQGVLSYAGAQLFVEFLAEMRRPRDFIKAMWGAQFFIYTVYLVYGCFVYYYQGQYSFNPSYQGMSIYAWQTVCNMITLIAALIAAGLYGNIGIKVFYNNVLIDLFNAPQLVTKPGKIIYACIVPVWWIIAFVIAASIPDYPGFVSVIAASCLLNLTYSLPPFFALGHDIQKNAIRPEQGEGFDPKTGQVMRESTMKRITRGFVSGGPLQVAMNVFHVLYFLGALATSGLGMWAAVQGLIDAFNETPINAFSCTSPLDLSPNKGN